MPSEPGCDLLDLLLIGFVVGLNNLATALALGAIGLIGRRPRIVTVFGIFEFVIPLVGIAIGRAAAEVIGTAAHWTGATLLVALGIVAIVIGTRGGHDDERLAARVASWRGLVLLAAGLSTDNLAVGFSLGLGDASPVVVATAIMLFSVTFTWIGIGVGAAGRRHWERYAEFGAGGLLVALGVAAGAGVI